jgi:APA family basic amino acid/polyamine antiporter
VARRKYKWYVDRAVGVPGAFGSAYAAVGACIFFSLGPMALHALGATPFAFLIAGVLFLAVTWAYAEAWAAIPELRGAASLSRRAYDQVVGFGTGWALTLDSVVIVALAALYVPHYLGTFWPGLTQWPYDAVFAAGVVAFAMLASVLVPQPPFRVLAVLGGLGLLALVVLMVAGFVLFFEHRVLLDQIDFGVAPTWGQLLYAIPLAAAAYAGIDAVVAAAPEMGTPPTELPRALNLLVLAIVVVGAGLAAVALSALPVGANVVPVDERTGRTEAVPVVPARQAQTFETLGGAPVFVPVERRGDTYVIPEQDPTGPVYQSDGQALTRLYGTQLGGAFLEDPVQGVVSQLPDSAAWLRRILRPVIAVLGAVLLTVVAYMGVAGSARRLYALARRRLLPASLGRVYASRMTPVVGVLLGGAAAIALVLPGSTTVLVELLGFGVLAVFALVQAAVVVMRYRQPGLARPWRLPWNVRWRNGSLPVVAVLGTAFAVAVWVAMVATHGWGTVVGVGWLAAGLLMYVVFRKLAGYPLRKPAEISQLPSTAEADVDYHRILVPVVGSRLTDEMLVLACQLATEKESLVDAVYVVEVPMERPLEDGLLPAERERAEKVLRLAAVVAADFGVELQSHVLPARHAGRSIVELAEKQGSDVVILGAVKKHRGGSVLGGTVEHVLRHAPSEVLVNLVQPDYPMVGSADEVRDPSRDDIDDYGAMGASRRK